MASGKGAAERGRRSNERVRGTMHGRSRCLSSPFSLSLSLPPLLLLLLLWSGGARAQVCGDVVVTAETTLDSRAMTQIYGCLYMDSLTVRAEGGGRGGRGGEREEERAVLRQDEAAEGERREEK